MSDWLATGQNSNLQSRKMPPFRTPRPMTNSPEPQLLPKMFMNVSSPR